MTTPPTSYRDLSVPMKLAAAETFAYFTVASGVAPSMRPERHADSRVRTPVSFVWHPDLQDEASASIDIEGDGRFDVYINLAMADAELLYRLVGWCTVERVPYSFWNDGGEATEEGGP